MTFKCDGELGSRGGYARRRARQIAYGDWQPWAAAAPVRAHVQELRRHGASFRAIGRAAGVSPMTVHRLLHGETASRRPAPQRVHACSARRLLAVTPEAACRGAGRRDAAGTRNRLRALTALGHSATGLAACADTAPRTISGLLNGRIATVSPALHAAIAELYDRLWDKPPAAQTGAQRRAASAARARAAAGGWPTPMGLDDDRIDDPAYQPRAHWRLVAPSSPSLACPPRAVTPLRATGHACQVGRLRAGGPSAVSRGQSPRRLPRRPG